MAGEGSRGGKVIGHTRSGKPIYASTKSAPKGEGPYGAIDLRPHARAHVDEHSDNYTWRDHLDAHSALMAEAKRHRAEGNEEQGYWHGAIAGAHRDKKEQLKMPPASTKLMNSLSVNKSNDKPAHVTDWEPMPKEFMADVEKCNDGGMYRKKSMEAPGDSDGDALDIEVDEAGSLSIVKAGGEGSRGGNVIGHTKSGKPIYQNATPKEYSDFTAADHADAASVHYDQRGRSKVSIEQEDRHMKLSDKHRDKAQSMRLRTLDSTNKNHHGPTAGGGGGGIGSTFGGNAGAGFQQGAALGTAVGSEAASGTPGAPHALGHAAMGKIGQAMTPKQGGSQGSTGSTGSKGAGGSMGVGATAKSCSACRDGTCEDKGHEMEKALTTRSLVIPFYMRQPGYDPNDTNRSATTQTSRMYTALAPDVADTIQGVMDSEQLRTRRAQEEFKRSQEIADMRNQLLGTVRPRGDLRFGR